VLLFKCPFPGSKGSCDPHSLNDYAVSRGLNILTSNYI